MRQHEGYITMTFFGLIISLLAVWRLGHMIQVESGPANMFGWLRNKLKWDQNDHARDGSLAELGQCFLCLSVWLSIPFAVWLAGDNWLAIIPLTLAISAAAIILNQITTERGL